METLVCQSLDFEFVTDKGLTRKMCWYGEKVELVSMSKDREFVVDVRAR